MCQVYGCEDEAKLKIEYRDTTHHKRKEHRCLICAEKLIKNSRNTIISKQAINGFEPHEKEEYEHGGIDWRQARLHML